MTLTTQQINNLQASINGYSFPPVYYDFCTNTEIHASNMSNLESAIKDLLLSSNLQKVKYGLANIVYWGNANAGYQMYRVNKFMNNVSNEELQQFQGLVANGNIPTLQSIKALGIPQFSGISFVSKIIAFIEPTNYCVLDLLLARLRNVPGNKSLNNLTVTTQIGITKSNSAAYYGWCQECLVISNLFYNGTYRAVDIERGIFSFIQNGNLELAQQIYIAA